VALVEPEVVREVVGAVEVVAADQASDRLVAQAEQEAGWAEQEACWAEQVAAVPPLEARLDSVRRVLSARRHRRCSPECP
jgi:hypothetical protein